MKQATIVFIFCLFNLKTHGQVTETSAHKPDYEAVKTELLQILNDDQEPKEACHATQDQHKKDSIKKVGVELEKKNLIKVKAILKRHGWVGPDQVGREANSALFLVIQHADKETQEQYLSLMRQAVAEGKVYSTQLALLEDRVALKQGKKQMYGSQIGEDEKTGASYVLPLEDPDHVDQRRRSVGLPPLAEYVSKWGIGWNVEEYKKRKLPDGKKDWKF